MKTILQSVALASAVALVASCDSSSGGSVNPPPPTPPTNSANGTAVKGLIDGASVTVTDADGDTLGTGTTSNGTYSITYDTVQVAAGVRLPIKVTVTGGSTLCDIDNAGTDDDCRTDTGFAKFGDSYTLPSSFALFSYLPAQVVTSNSNEVINISPATHIAGLKAEALSTAAGATADDVVKASAAIAGLIQTISGVDLSGTPLHQLSVADLTATGGSATPAQLAVASFAAAILADQGATESLADVIARFAAALTVNADGTTSVSGDNLATIADALAKGLATAAAKSGNAELTQAANTAAQNANLYKSFGNNPVKLPPTSTPGTDKTDVQKTQDFVAKLAKVINGIVATTGAQGGGQDISVTEAFATELDGVRKLSSTEAGKAASQLDAALLAAAKELTDDSSKTTITNDATSEDGLAFVLTQTDTGFNVTGVSSQWPKAPAADAVSVTITGAEGSVSSTGINVPNVTMVTKKGDTTLQTFTGKFTTTNGDAAGKYTEVVFDGDIAGQTAGTGFGIDAKLTDVTVTDTSTTGSYTATISFTHATATDLSVTFNGTIGAATQNFTVKSGEDSINGTVNRVVANGVTTDTDTFSDGVAFLTLTVVDGNVSVGQGDVIGKFTVGSGEAAKDTGTLLKNGQVNYSDNTVQFLPAVIF